MRSLGATLAGPSTTSLGTEIETKLKISSTTRACCPAVNCGNIGKDTIVAAAFSATGKSPELVIQRT